MATTQKTTEGTLSSVLAAEKEWLRGPAVARYTHCLMNGDYTRAAGIATTAKLEEGEKRVAATKAYETCFANGRFFANGHGWNGLSLRAAEIARDFKLGTEKVTTAAEEACKECIIYGDYSAAAETARKFGLGQGVIGEIERLAELKILIPLIRT